MPQASTDFVKGRLADGAREGGGAARTLNASARFGVTPWRPGHPWSALTAFAVAELCLDEASQVGAVREQALPTGRCWTPLACRRCHRARGRGCGCGVRGRSGRAASWRTLARAMRGEVKVRRRQCTARPARGERATGGSSGGRGTHRARKLIRSPHGGWWESHGCSRNRDPRSGDRSRPDSRLHDRDRCYMLELAGVIRLVRRAGRGRLGNKKARWPGACAPSHRASFPGR